jgi:XTP/dITP diphosphohydrolase
MPTIVLATANPHKVSELRAIFAEAAVEVIGLADLPGARDYSEPIEDGDTFEANAEIKALAYARQTGRVCLADDSGLEVDALGGAPGVYSARYSSDLWNGDEPDRATRDALNNDKLLTALDGVPLEQRTARFVCAMALADPGERTGEPTVLATVRGAFEGLIGLPPSVPRGENGFGYDPLFLVAPDHSETSAELPPQRKNQISHRASAAATMARLAPDLLGVDKPA